MELKLVINDTKTGKTYVKEIKEPNASGLKGLKIGQTFKGERVDMTGYEFEITGGSDNAGFAMRKDVKGVVRKRIPIIKGVGVRKNKRRGLKIIKTVAGNTVYAKTAEINVKIIKEGREKLVAPEKPAEEKGKEKKEEKPAEKKEEKPKEPAEEKQKQTKEKDKEKPAEEKPEKPEKEPNK